MFDIITESVSNGACVQITFYVNVNDILCCSKMKWKEHWNGSQKTWSLTLILTQSLCVTLFRKRDIFFGMCFSQLLSQVATRCFLLRGSGSNFLDS